MHRRRRRVPDHPLPAGRPPGRARRRVGRRHGHRDGLRTRRQTLPRRQAAALGAIQGPAELLPVSSSGHIALIPALLGWPYASLDAELRKSFEVALHAGTAAALCIALRNEIAEVFRDLDPGRLARHVVTFLPAAAAGYLLEKDIEERLGGPRQVALAQVGAGLVLVAADRAPARRRHEDAGLVDALAIGVAQAAALAPGVSRNGATLAAARILRFERGAANRLSRHAALPVIVGATALKGVRLARRGLPRGVGGAFAAGAGTAFVSTLAAGRLVPLMDRARSYAPFGVYRVALGLAALGSRPPGRMRA